MMVKQASAREKEREREPRFQVVNNSCPKGGMGGGKKTTIKEIFFSSFRFNRARVRAQEEMGISVVCTF
jgi:hypothetical protein